jgi:hypothetical protein
MGSPEFAPVTFSRGRRCHKIPREVLVPNNLVVHHLGLQIIAVVDDWPPAVSLCVWSTVLTSQQPSWQPTWSGPTGQSLWVELDWVQLVLVLYFDRVKAQSVCSPVNAHVAYDVSLVPLVSLRG